MTQMLRLTSSRAPWRRAGIAFTSTRKPVEVAVDDLSKEQVSLLEQDVAIKIEAFEVESPPVSDPKGATGAPAPGGAAPPLGPTAGVAERPASDGGAAGAGTPDVTSAEGAAASADSAPAGEGSAGGDQDAPPADPNKAGKDASKSK